MFLKERHKTQSGKIKSSRPKPASCMPPLVFVLEAIALLIFMLTVLDLMDAYFVLQAQATGQPLFRTTSAPQERSAELLQTSQEINHGSTRAR